MGRIKKIYFSKKKTPFSSINRFMFPKKKRPFFILVFPSLFNTYFFFLTLIKLIHISLSIQNDEMKKKKKCKGILRECNTSHLSITHKLTPTYLIFSTATKKNPSFILQATQHPSLYYNFTFSFKFYINFFSCGI